MTRWISHILLLSGVLITGRCLFRSRRQEFFMLNKHHFRIIWCQIFPFTSVIMGTLCSSTVELSHDVVPEKNSVSIAKRLPWCKPYLLFLNKRPANKLSKTFMHTWVADEERKKLLFNVSLAMSAKKQASKFKSGDAIRHLELFARAVALSNPTPWKYISCLRSFNWAYFPMA